MVKKIMMIFVVSFILLIGCSSPNVSEKNSIKVYVADNAASKLVAEEISVYTEIYYKLKEIK